MADVESENLNKIDDMINAVDGGKNPSRKELLDMLEQSEMDGELKENLRSMLSGNVPQLFGAYGGGTWLGIVFVMVIFSVLLFFGYKLYKSIKDKEIKREEKKKAKQMKKKK